MIIHMLRLRWINALLIFWGIQVVVFLCALWNEELLHLAFESLQFEWNETFRLALIQFEPGLLHDNEL